MKVALTELEASSAPERSVPIANQDFMFFYEGLRDQRLLVQKCGNCGRLRNPPGPMCQTCASTAVEILALEGVGTVYSYTVHCHPPILGFSAPQPIALVTMKEDVRMLGAIADVVSSESIIGRAVATEFYQHDDGPRFRFRLSSK